MRGTLVEITEDRTHKIHDQERCEKSLELSNQPNRFRTYRLFIETSYQ